MMNLYTFISSFLTMMIVVNSLKTLPLAITRRSVSPILNSPTAVYSLDSDTILKLEEMKSKYNRLSNVVSAEADAEKASLEEIVTKYTLYKEVKSMMSKLRLMWTKEVSERRKEKQVKSFSKLYQGKLEIEEILKQKLGLPSSKTAIVIPELKNLEKINLEISSLQSRIESTKFALPPGKSTREERYL